MIPIREDFGNFFDIPPRLPNGAAAHFGLRSASGVTSLCDQRQPGRQSQRPILATSGRTPSGPEPPISGRDWQKMRRHLSRDRIALRRRNSLEFYYCFRRCGDGASGPGADGFWSSCFGMPCLPGRKVSRCFINPTISFRTRRSAWRRTNFNPALSSRVMPRRFRELPFKQRGARASFRASSMHFMQVDACRQPN